MEPVADRLAPAGRGGLASQHKKSRLENVLGILHARQDAAADAQHQGSVTPDQHGEGAVVMLPGEALKKLTIRQTVGFRRAGHAA